MAAVAEGKLHTGSDEQNFNTWHHEMDATTAMVHRKDWFDCVECGQIWKCPYYYSDNGKTEIIVLSEAFSVHTSVLSMPH